MAFSMFLRNSKNLTPIFRQQLARLATQTCLAPRSCLPAVSVAMQKAFVAPRIQMHNPIRSLQTSVISRKANEVVHHEHAHDHARLWVIEKAVTASLVVVIPAALLYPSRILDSIMAILVCAHSFWGLEAIAVDYVRASVVGPILPKIALGLVYAVTIATLGGLFYVIGHDVGIANTVRSLWSVKSEKHAYSAAP